MAYNHMKEMIYGEKPSFDEIMESITNLEREINGLNADYRHLMTL